MKEIHVRQIASHEWEAYSEGCADDGWGNHKDEALGELMQKNPQVFGIVIVQHPKQCECEGCKGRRRR